MSEASSAKPSASAESSSGNLASGERTSSEPASGPRRWTLRQRIVLSMIVGLGYSIIRLLGPTLRISVSYEDGAQEKLDDRPLIASFWHSCMIPATYIFRDMGIRVMSSYSYDGEYMGRIIRKFGFVAVKGSSSRNAVRALLGLRRALEDGWTVAFTLDGPRGPRHKVKPGPVALARSSGLAMTTFHAAVENAWVLNSWDRMMIPKPFSRVLVRVGKLIPVPTDASDEDLARYTDELQSTLDRVCAFAEENVNRAGTKNFPYYKRP
ncbi:MAG TPA: lysophospholipid acyltransferase family protein [Candidatus Sulfotelmatobacter sp.]|nr:lysophospholipid acyltransferase family protein [Candidatus Sulfotelmatobacter sp.]